MKGSRLPQGGGMHRVCSGRGQGWRQHGGRSGIEHRLQGCEESECGIPELLLYSPPETRGMLLYQLTRHGKLTKADLRNWDDLEVLSRRKRAVVTIIKSVQTKRDYENSLQHIHPTGDKAGDWRTKERELLQFLEMGLGNSTFDDEVKKFVEKLRSGTIALDLHEEPAKGYAVAYNDTMQYFAQAGNHPLFACGGAASVVANNDKTMVA